MKKRISQVIWILIFLVACASPIAIYASQFGFGVWEEHSKWAEMGSAFSGIYSPLIAFLALIILLAQRKSQVAMDKHNYDQAYIRANREDIDFYIDRLEKYLDEGAELNKSPRQFIAFIAKMKEEDLREEETISVCQAFYDKNRKIVDIWIAIYPILVGIGSQQDFPYKQNYTSILLKLSTVLSMESCIGLDKLLYSVNSKVKRTDARFW